MFARILPLLRLPRRFGVFDYRVPDGVRVAVGDLVRVPFHGRTIVGAVAALSDVTEVRGDLSDVQDVAFPAALGAGDIARTTSLAQAIAQSPSTLLHYAFGAPNGDRALPRAAHASPASLSLPREVADAVSAAVAALDGAMTLSCQLSPEGAYALAQVLRKRTREQLLIVVPRERDADLLGRTIAFGGHTAVLHGHTKPAERERIIHAWRSGAVTTLIGTLQASLLPAKRIGLVLVMTTGTDDHFSNRRNPRLDTRLAAEAQAAQHGAPLVLCDSLPRPEDRSAADRSVVLAPSQAVVVDLRRPEESTGSELVTERLLAEMKTALQSQKKVLLFYNRKGVARRVQCRSCGHVLTCRDCGSIPKVADAACECPRCRASFPIPDACPSCTHGRLGLKGIGNAHLEKSLAEFLPGTTIARIEKGRPPDVDANVLLVTEYYFANVAAPFAPKAFGLVADACIDLSMNPDDFRAAETTARKLHRLSQFARQQGASCVIQTWMPDAIVPMTDADVFLTNERAVRERYALPPYGAVITVRHADAEAVAAVVGAPFIPEPEILGAIGRIPYDTLSASIAQLAALPDTAVISVDQTYVRTHRAPQSES
ncbi:hypothetical protein HYS28_01600 [Candidatus Uhrbacteria bacterium]|nr:hypothetical protein [Candidatus Uhrbacteria bacterium]